jgi:hypothetical protein
MRREFKEQYLNSNRQTMFIHVHRTVCNWHFKSVHYNRVSYVEYFVVALQVVGCTVGESRVQEDPVITEKFLLIRNQTNHFKSND